MPGLNTAAGEGQTAQSPIVDERIVMVHVTDTYLTVQLRDRRVISVPLDWSWRLIQASPDQRQRFEIVGEGEGIHWPELDEDLSAWGLLRGHPAPRPGSQPHLRQQVKRTRMPWKPDRIIQLREQREWTQTQLAQHVGVRQATVSDWETGKAQPSRRMRVRLAQLESSIP